MPEIELYQEMMNKDPSSHAFIYLAEAYLERGMYEEAIETCVSGLRLRPHDLRVRVVLGLSCLRTGALDRAETELQKAREMLEINAVTYQALAELYDQKGDSEQAARYRKVFESIHLSETITPEPEVTELEIETEPETEEAQKGRRLLSILEKWQGRLRERVHAESLSSPTEPGSLDLEKLVAFVKKHAEGLRSS